MCLGEGSNRPYDQQVSWRVAYMWTHTSPYRHGHGRVLHTKEIVSPCPSLSDFSSGLFQFPGYLKPSQLKYHQLLQRVRNCQPVFRAITRLPAGPCWRKALTHCSTGKVAALPAVMRGSPLTSHEPPTLAPSTGGAGAPSRQNIPYTAGDFALPLPSPCTVLVPETRLSLLPLMRASVLQESFGKMDAAF